MNSDFTSKHNGLWSSGTCTVLMASIKFSVDCSLCRDSSVSGFSIVVRSQGGGGGGGLLYETDGDARRLA